MREALAGVCAGAGVIEKVITASKPIKQPRSKKRPDDFSLMPDTDDDPLIKVKAETRASDECV